MGYVDKTLTCQDCGAEFVFSAGEQAYYADNGLKHEPSRCPRCRRLNRPRDATEAEKQRDAANLARSERRARKARAEQGGKVFATVTEGDRELYLVPCAQCGREARVPFQPRGSKPVLCQECFQRKRMNGAR
jgi:CxxC-x17-CxxC domain-containing protein